VDEQLNDPESSGTGYSIGLTSSGNGRNMAKWMEKMMSVSYWQFTR